MHKNTTMILRIQSKSDYVNGYICPQQKTNLLKYFMMNIGNDILPRKKYYKCAL